MLPATSEGQILGVPQNGGEPAFWGSVSIGLLQLGTVDDGETQSSWDFGTGAQYRAALEWGIGRQSSIGVTATHARMPLSYFSTSEPTCTRCNAHADVQSANASFHAGGGAGFHQIVEIQAGFTRFGNFRTDQGDAELPPSADTDFSFGLGYGFGYGFSERMQVMFVQDYTTSLHQRDGLPGGSRSTTQHLITRLGLRYGIGSK